MLGATSVRPQACRGSSTSLRRRCGTACPLRRCVPTVLGAFALSLGHIVTGGAVMAATQVWLPASPQ
jgi:hypothetical protein